MIQSVCDINPCKNDGACIVKYANNTQTPECICQSLYYGKYCELGNIINSYNELEVVKLNGFILSIANM